MTEIDAIYFEFRRPPMSLVEAAAFLVSGREPEPRPATAIISFVVLPSGQRYFVLASILIKVLTRMEPYDEVADEAAAEVEMRVEVEVEIPAGDMAINSEEKLPQAIWLCAEVWQRDWQAEVNTSRDGLRG